MYERNWDYERSLATHAPDAEKAEEAAVRLLTAKLPVSATAAASSPVASPALFVHSPWREIAHTVRALLDAGREPTADAVRDTMLADVQWGLRQMGLLDEPGVDTATVVTLAGEANRLPEIHLRRTWLYESRALMRVAGASGGATPSAMFDALDETTRRLALAGTYLDGRDRPVDLPAFDPAQLPVEIESFGYQSDHQLEDFENTLLTVCKTDAEALFACRGWLRQDDFTNTRTQRLWRETVRDLEAGKVSRSGGGVTGHQYGPDYNAAHLALGSARRRFAEAKQTLTDLANSPVEPGDTAELVRRNDQVITTLRSTHRELTRLLSSPEAQRALGLLQTPVSSRQAKHSVPDVSHLLDPAVPGGNVPADYDHSGPARARPRTPPPTRRGRGAAG